MVRRIRSPHWVFVLRARPIDPVTVLVGVFNGSPVANNAGDPQKRNPSGTSFPLNGGVLAIAELQYAYPSLGTMVYAADSEPLARVYKLGFWYDTERFADQEFDNTGLSLANPATTGIPSASWRLCHLCRHGPNDLA